MFHQLQQIRTKFAVYRNSFAIKCRWVLSLSETSLRILSLPRDKILGILLVSGCFNRCVMIMGLWRKYDVDGHYFIFMVQILANYNNYVLYDTTIITIWRHGCYVTYRKCISCYHLILNCSYLFLLCRTQVWDTIHWRCRMRSWWIQIPYWLSQSASLYWR